MAKGEQRTWSAAGQEISRFSNNPIPADDYGLLLLSQGLEIRRSLTQGPNAVPYIAARFEAQGTAEKEGQKNRLVFKNFLLSLKPGKDQKLNPLRGGGLAEFYRARGSELDAPVLTKDIRGDDGEVIETVEYLDPEVVLAQLQEWVDTVTQGHVKIDKPRDQMVNGKLVKADPKDPGKNDIDQWHVTVAEAPAPAPAAASGGLKKKK